MKAITISVILMLFAGVLAVAGQEEVLNLSTLGKKPVTEPIVIAKATSTISKESRPAIELSTLGKKKAASTVPVFVIKASTPLTLTPSFSIQNANITSGAPTIFTLPQSIPANPTRYTPPIAIFGGA